MVLVVDDESDALGLAERTLRERFEVLLAQSGAEAMKHLASRKVDLIVTDQRMLDMTGIELVRQVRALYSALPVVLVSAYGDSQILVDALDLGVARFLAKPFRAEELSHVVDAVLASRAQSLATVLVVDDSQEIRELLATALARAGHRALCASNADEALATARNHKIDLALVDIALPGTSGLELTATLKRDRPLLPVIVVSAMESIDVAIEAMRLGVADYVTKPFRFREILFRVERALEMTQRAVDAVGLEGEADDVLPLREAMDLAERAYLERLLAKAAGDLDAAANAAKLSREELGVRLARLGIRPEGRA